MKTKFSGILTLLLAFVVQLTFAQGKTISGTISDGDNLPLPGVNVLVKGTSNGTTTDFDGKYSISANTGDVLVFSYVGNTVEKTVGASNDISFVMNENALEEVVITVLGVERKADELTSSTQIVKAETLTQASNPNVIQSLAGKVSGLKINTTNNGVNQSTRIVLRGNRSLTGSNEALIVIDGAISSANTLANLAPEIIESTNVIKGAGGSALYGSQGANGVIIVTTKRGTADEKINIAVNTSISFEDISFLPQRQTKYGQGWNGGHVTYENGGWGPEFDGSIQPVGLAQADGSYIMAPYSPIEDNIEQFFQTGTIAQTGVSISGGDTNSYALLSVNRQNTEFVVQDDKLGRTNVLFKAGKKIGKWDIGGNINYVNSKTETTTSSLFTELLQTATNVPVEQFANSGNEGHWTSYYRSPYWMRDNIRNTTESDRFNGIINLKYEINDNISLSSLTSLRTFSSNFVGYTNEYTDTSGVGGGDHSTVSQFATNNQESKNFYNDIFVNFNYMLTDDLSFKATLGNNVQDNWSSLTSVNGSNVTIPNFYNISNITGIPGVSNSSFRSRSYALFGSFDFGFKDYLFLTLTGRNDWTSRLAADRNSFFYPSVGVSFVPTTAFPSLKEGGVLNYAKISANLARVGNDRVGTYETNSTLNQVAGYPYGGLNSFAIDATVADPLLVNEFIDSKEVSLNLAFFKGDRITLGASYYITNNKDLVTNVSTSTASGLTNSTINIGETETKGYEIDLGITPIRTADFRWDINMSLSSDETIVKKVSDNTDEVSLGNGNADVGIFATVGEPFPLIKGTGYQRDPQGRVLIDPSTGNPLKTSEFINLGVANPDYIVGLNTSLTYKGFRLAGVFDYRTGHQFWAGTKDWLSWSGHLVESAENGRRGFIFPNSAIETSPGVYQANTNVVTGGTTYANYLDYFSNEYRDVSENFVLDATAFKVRELSLSYAFNKDVLNALGFSDFRIGINARNPFVVLPKENRGYADPEFSNTTGNAQGLSVTGQYPATRTYGMTVNLTF
ncbi:TonB-linked SusC/RagA family outer membrane protein [Lacinutrix venerupis]|uniref:SusC/RagA family TonB-linked outer membrane protein n=1 Tax=Lacinutrix venerupis TaxID=1486034 RepID=UPI000EAFCD16|nr:SusC/RagA family TonB-linked outer membrane protein [Lacinutrix venerupis]RLJ61954.1 TonB-linked SusC/RagA family outer membrane protein [Lacinutrix venerupis]